MWLQLQVLVLILAEQSRSTYRIISLHFTVSALYCYEGTNCALPECGECQGIACVRVVRAGISTQQSAFLSSMRSLVGHKPEKISPDSIVAYTCLPVGTRVYDLEPEGCRSDPLNQRMMCLCYNKDYCNNNYTAKSSISLVLSLLVFYLLTLCFICS